MHIHRKAPTSYSFVLSCRQAYDTLKDAYPQESTNIVQTCLSIDTPKDIISWLSDKTSDTVEMLPTKVKRDINALTTYLLKEASQDVCESLLDGLSLLEDSSSEEESSSSQEEEEEQVEQPLFFMDTSMNTESESDNTKTLRKNINTLVLGLNSDSTQDKSPDSDNTSQSEDSDVDMISEDDNDDESKQEPSIAHQGRKSQDKEVESSSEEEQDEGDELVEEEDDKIPENESEDESDDKDEEAGEVDDSEEQSDDDAGDDKEKQQNEKDPESDDERRDVKESPKRLKSAAGSPKMKGADTEERQEKKLRSLSRMRSTRQKSKASESGDGLTSNGDETFVTCTEEVDDKDVFFDADEDVCFKNKSPEKTPPSKAMPAEHRNFMDTPNTYLSNSKRRSTRLNMNGSKSGAGQTTLEHFFSPQPKSVSKDESVTVIPETQLSNSESENEEQGAESKVLRSADKECVITATRSPKKLTPPPSKQKLSQAGSGKSKQRLSVSKTKPSRLSRRVKEGETTAKEASLSPVFHLTESQLSQVVTHPDGEVVPESDGEDALKSKDKQLEDVVIEGIKEIRKSSSPSQSPSPRRRMQSQVAGHERKQDTVENRSKDLRTSSSPTPLMIIEVNGILLGSKKDIENDQESKRASDDSKSYPSPTQSKKKQKQKARSTSTRHGTSGVTSPPSAKKAAADFGNVYRMMAGIGLSSQDSQSDQASLEDFKLTNTSKKSRLEPKVLLNKFPTKDSDVTKSDLKDVDNIGSLDNPVEGLRSHTISESSQVSETSVSRRSSRSKNHGPSSSTLVPGKPPIPSTNSKRRSVKATSASEGRQLRSRYTSDDEPSSPPTSRRSKRNSESAIASEHSVPVSPRKNQNVEPVATLVPGKPPIPNSRSKKSIKAGSSSEGSLKRALHSIHTSEDEPSSPPRRSRRSKRNSESSVASEHVSPQRSQRFKQTSERSYSSQKQAAATNNETLKQVESFPIASPPRIRRSKRNSESSVASEHVSPQRSQRLKKTHSSQKRAAATNNETLKQLESFPVASPPRIRRSKRNSESSVASELSVPSVSKRSALSQSAGKLYSTFINSSQESGVYPLPSSATRQEQKREESLSQSSSLLPGTGYAHTLRSRRISESSSQDEPIMASQESITATQLLRRDIDMRKLKYYRMNEEDDDVPKPKKKRAAQKPRSSPSPLPSPSHASSRPSPSRSPSQTQESSSTLKSKRKSSRKK
ncbi:uncharacterized protein [Amphiura filiformis]|uniref:uncharacterized protein n=1 Tax=Amphiura filiformis TaxID=82378 RepID=UPI003B21D426